MVLLSTPFEVVLIIMQFGLQLCNVWVWIFVCYEWSRECGCALNSARDPCH